MISERSSAKAPFFSSCVSWPRKMLPALEYLAEHGEDIDYDAFLAHVDADQQAGLERALGYDEHLSVRQDYHVRFRRVPDHDVFFMAHSATEYVYATPEAIVELNEIALAQDLDDEPTP